MEYGLARMAGRLPSGNVGGDGWALGGVDPADRLAEVQRQRGVSGRSPSWPASATTRTDDEARAIASAKLPRTG